MRQSSLSRKIADGYSICTHISCREITRSGRLFASVQLHTFLHVHAKRSLMIPLMITESDWQRVVIFACFKSWRGIAYPARPCGRLCGRASLAAVDYQAVGEIVWRKGYGHSIAQQDFNSESGHPARKLRSYASAVIGLDLVHSS